MRLGSARGRTPVLPLLAVVSLILSACSGTAASPSAAPATAAPATAAPATAAPATAAPATAAPATAAPATAAPSTGGTAGGGGVATIAYVGPCCNGVDWLTPWDGGGDAAWISKIYGRLTTFMVLDVAAQQAGDPQGGTYGELVGELAESWAISDDKLTWTFNLRKGVTWHDGEAFTTNDIKYTFETCLSPKNSMAPAYYCAPLNTVVGAKEILDGSGTELTGLKLIDATTFSLTFTAPNALFPTTISELFILPQHALKDIALDQLKTSDYWSTKQIGLGPFKWDKYTPTQSIELVPFADYWRGAPKLDRLIRREFQDAGAALLAFDNGELDFTYLTADEVAREKSNPNAIVLPGGSGVNNELFLQDVKHPEFQNSDFRQALLYAIDRTAIVDNIFGGGATIVPCLYARPNLNAGVEPQPYDPVKAKELLTSSGVDVNALGTINIATYYRDPLSANVMTAILKNWSDNLGIKTGSVQALDDAAYQEASKSGNYDVMYIGAANGPTGDRGFVYLHSSTAYPAGGTGAFAGDAYINPAIDKLFEDARSEFDTAKQDALYQQACQIMKDDLPVIYLWQSVRYHVANPKLQNLILIPAAGGGSYYDAAELWVKAP